MTHDRDQGRPVSRRGLLSGVVAGGAAVSIGAILPPSVRASNGDVTLLGDFESGLDGWRTNGGNELARVTEAEAPGSVTRGEYALDVTVRGDPFPMIENETRVADAEFTTHPYLIADVVPGAVSDTESDITFAFRYHHTDTPADGGEGGTRQEKPVLVEESDPITVPALVPSQVYWDMSDLPEGALSAPERLEVVWYPTDHPPDVGPRGRGPGFDYRGSVTFDNIRLSDSASDLSVVRVADTMRTLALDHGPIGETVTTARSADLETGEFVFADGTRIPFRFETLGDGEYRYVIDGTAFPLGRDG